MQKLFLFALLTVTSTGAFAQRSLSAAPHFSPGRGQTFSSAASIISRPGFSEASRFGRTGPRSLFDLFGIFSNSLYSDPISESGYPVASQSPGIILQNALASGHTAEPIPQAAQPLLIELQGNSYVRLSGPDDIHTGTSRTEPARQELRPSSLFASVNNHPSAAASLAPVTLIFRDGHHDEVSDYTIADGILYTRGDYYADGSWRKKIELSTLDLPQTIKLNQA